MASPTDIGDGTTQVTRIPAAALATAAERSSAVELPARGPASAGSGGSMTQALRAQRKVRRRRHPTDTFAAVPSVRPAADAAFPALVSVLFTGPYAVRLWTAGEHGIAAAVIAAGIAVTFAGVSLLSRHLDRRTR